VTNFIQRTPVVQLALMRLRLFLREPGGMFWTFGFPIVVSLILGMAFRSRAPDPIFVAVVEGAGSERAKQILQHEEGVHVRIESRGHADEDLRTGKVAVVVSGGEPLEFRFDESRPESRLARRVINDAFQQSAGRTDPIPVRESKVAEPGARYIDFLVPGLLGLGLMSTGLWGIGFSLAEMRTRKLLKRLVATPMRKVDFLASFLLVRVFVLVFEVPLFLLFAHYALDVQIPGSWVAIGAVAFIGSMTFSTIGLLIACRTESSHVVSGVINVVSFPMYLCSGVFFSYERFPSFIQPLIRAFPLTVLIEALRRTILDGAALQNVLTELITLLLWWATCFALALKLFRWR